MRAAVVVAWLLASACGRIGFEELDPGTGGDDAPADAARPDGDGGLTGTVTCTPPCNQASEYCAVPEGTCSGDGTCGSRLGNCLDVIDPVCGCNGQTYENDCKARTAGVNIASRGACGGESAL